MLSVTDNCHIWRQTIGGNDMIIKQITYGGSGIPEESSSEQLQQLASKELAIYEQLYTLQGTGIPKLYYAGEMLEGICDCVATSYEGTALDEIKNLTFSTEFVNKCCAILHSIHNLDVIHGDIELRNVLINQHGDPVLIDFGCSKISNNKKKRQLK